MPHVVVKIVEGRSEQQKARIAHEVTRAIVDTAGCGKDAVSVSIEDVAQADWTASVYNPEIRAKPDTLYKKPGYEPQ